MRNVGNASYISNKPAGIKPILVITSILEIVLVLVVIYSLRSERLPSGLLIVLIIIWRAIVAYHVLVRMKAELVTKTIRKAIKDGGCRKIVFSIATEAIGMCCLTNCPKKC